MTGHQRERQAELKNRFAGLIGAGAPAAPAAPPAAAPPARRRAKRTEPAAPAPAAKESAPAAPAAPARRRPSKAASAPAVPPMPVAQESTTATRDRRLMVPLAADEDQALKEYRLRDGIPAAARVRAMLQLYRTDERFRRKVDEQAKRMR